MTEPEARIEGRTQTQAQRDEPGAGEGARKRLLAGLPVAERQLHLNGVSTAVLEGGDGPPIVLLHGPGEHAAKWFQVLPELVTSHHVVAPDLPGHGASGVIGGTLDAVRVLGWLDELIERTCPAPAALVGHVLGGAIAARYAVERGERIRSLVLVDALGLAAFQPAPDFALALGAFISEPTEDAHDRLWTRCAFDLDAMRARMGKRWAWIKTYNLDRARAPGVKAAQEALMEQFGFAAISPSELARIAVPTTLVWGRHDLATPVSVAQAASTRYGWPLRVIENAGDDPPMEQPEAFLEALHAALGSSDRARGAEVPEVRDPE
jgi:pimeloyl-ACP methyl ester carboxylesterase